MSAPCPTPVRNSRRAHRRLIVVCGSLAIVGAALAAFVHPAWAALVTAGGVWLLLAPESGG